MYYNTNIKFNNYQRSSNYDLLLLYCIFLLKIEFNVRFADLNIVKSFFG